MIHEGEFGTTSPKRSPLTAEGRLTRGAWRPERGFTIVEVMIASLILIVGGLALVGLVDAANGATTSNKQREAATNLAREVIENVGTIAYDDVTPAGVVDELQAREGLEDSDGNAAGYTLERRDVTYALELEVCNLDDASDGIGSRVTGADGVPFCDDSLPGGTSDSRPGDYRRVTATARWTLDGEAKTVRQSSFVMPPSGSDLPVVTTLTPSESSPIDENYTGETVGFTATTSSIPAGVSWSQEGTEMGEATGGGTSWNFTWQIGDVASGLVDGDYVIGARGRTGGGSYGPVHPLNMKLNRSWPKQPQGFVAGLNGSSVDSEWLANRERDIKGYTVYRKRTAPTTGSPEKVNCGTTLSPVFITTSLTCTDASPLSTASNVSFVAATNVSAEASSIALAPPAGVAENDVMIATIAAADGSAGITAPAGWTPIRNTPSATTSTGIRHASYYRVVPSGTLPTSYSWNLGSARSSSGSITAWRGVDTTAPIDVSAELPGGSSNGATETAPSVTTTGVDRTVIRAFAHRGPANGVLSLSTPTATTSRSGSRSNSTVHGQFSRSQAAAGATGTATTTCTHDTLSCTQWAAQTIALKPKLSVAADYWVTAVDLDDDDAYREGPASTAVAAYAANTAPTAPSGLSGTAAANGSNVVSWTTQGGDADAGDSVSFYRVYRDGVRFDKTGTGSDTTWTDPNPGSGTHTYLLKAVDTHLAESPASTSVSVTQP